MNNVDDDDDLLWWKLPDRICCVRFWLLPFPGEQMWTMFACKQRTKQHTETHTPSPKSIQFSITYKQRNVILKIIEHGNKCNGQKRNHETKIQETQKQTSIIIITMNQ